MIYDVGCCVVVRMVLISYWNIIWWNHVDVVACIMICHVDEVEVVLMLGEYMKEQSCCCCHLLLWHVDSMGYVGLLEINEVEKWGK